ncbi:hypothetical protein AB0J83_39025 [Actinoplanes sp. NPDC049596]|uniref:hypothetical protein n=1 Tax=unclassified Actinoplanes TaxID=2626549 RepID=UPI0034252856
MSLEEDLRTTLHERATQHVPQPDLLGAVGAGIRRDRRRRQALAAGGAAVAIAVVAVAVPALRPDDTGPPPAPPAHSESPPAKMDLSWPKVPVVAFPMLPHWVPAGLGEPGVTRLGPNTRLDYTKGTQVLSAEIGPLQPDWEVEAEQEHMTTVNGRPAVVHASGSYDGSRPGDRFVGVRWQLPDKRWVQVLSLGPTTEADVLRFAEGLSTGSVPAPPTAFRVGAVPPQLALQHQSTDTTCLAPAAEAARERQPTGLCVTLTDEAEPPPGPSEKLSINGNPADYYAGVADLQIHLPNGKDLDITWDPESVPLTHEEAVHFATGIEAKG